MPAHFTHLPFIQEVLHMFHLQREGPTTAGGNDRATKVQVLKSTGQLGVHNIITSWYLQFTESYKVFCLKKKKDIQHVLTHMLTQSSCKRLKKNLTHFTLQKCCI